MADINEEDLHLFVMQRVEIDQLEARLKQVKRENKALAEKLFDDIHMLNLRSLPHRELGRFTPIARLYVNIAKPTLDQEGNLVNVDAQAQLEAWSKARKDETGRSLFEDLFGWVVKSSRLRTLVKDRLDENLDPPPGVEHGFTKDIQYTPPKQSTGEADG